MIIQYVFLLHNGACEDEIEQLHIKMIVSNSLLTIFIVHLNKILINSKTKRIYILLDSFFLNKYVPNPKLQIIITIIKNALSPVFGLAIVLIIFFS